MIESLSGHTDAHSGTRVESWETPAFKGWGFRKVKEEMIVGLGKGPEKYDITEI